MAHKTLRPMSVRDLFDEAFDLYKRNFALIFGLSLVMLPVQLFISLAYQSQSHGVRTAARVIMNTGLATNAFLLTPLWYYVTTWAVSRCYLNKAPTIMESIKSIVTRLWPCLLIFWLLYLMMFLGLMLCIIPGILLAFGFVFLSEVLALEKLSYMDAVRRSSTILLSDLWRVLGVLILEFTFMFLISAVLRLPFTHTLHFLFKQPHRRIGLAEAITSELAGVFISPIWTITNVLLYYDIRVRKEHFDLRMLAKSMESGAVV